MFITSIGIFGFLSKAHLDTSAPNTGNRLLVKNIERQIESEKKAITGAQKIVDQLDKALDKVIDKDADKGLIERQKQQNERNRANNIITSSSNKITQLSNQKLNYDKNQLAIDKEIGPFKYVAEILFGDADDGNLDRAVRFVIICLLFVFDPLAVLMLVAVNVSIKEYERNKKNIKDFKITYPKEVLKTVKNESENDIKDLIFKKIKEKLTDKNKSKKERDRDYEKFVQDLGAKELEGLSPDEIKIKLDQIYDWNDKKGKDEKNT
jgi:DNA-binding MarR family transcriptional regulator